MVLYSLEWFRLFWGGLGCFNGPGQSYYTRTPQDTLGHPRTSQHLKIPLFVHFSILTIFWSILRFISIKCTIEFIGFISVWISQRIPQDTSIYHRTLLSTHKDHKDTM